MADLGQKGDPRQKAELTRAFSKRLVDLREEKGLKKTAIAKAVGIGVRTYDGWECSGHLPRVELLVRLAECLEVSVDDLLGRANDRPAVAAPTVITRPDHSAPEVITRRGVAWHLRWSRPSPERIQGAKILKQVIDGQPLDRIGRTLGLGSRQAERLAQELVLDDDLVVDSVPRDEAREQTLRDWMAARENPALHVAVARIDQIQEPAVRYILLGYLASELFRAEVRYRMSVGLCGGFAVRSMVMALRRADVPTGLRVVSMAATPILESAHLSANSVVSALVNRLFDLDLEAIHIPAPSSIVAPDTTSPLAAIARHVLEEAAKVSFVFMGAGAPGTGAVSQYLTGLRRSLIELAIPNLQATLTEIRDDPAVVGDIFYHYIDKAGWPVAASSRLNEHLVYSIGLDGLRTLVASKRYVVVIASGREKAAVVRAAVTARYVNALIVDQELADAIVDAGTPRSVSGSFS